MILSKIIPRHGCPATILSDNGTEFVNTVVREVCKEMNIYRVRTSPYHPQSNGKLERVHRVWNDIASKGMRDPRTWDDMVPFALLALRTAIHETSQHTPYFLMTGRDPMLPLDTLLCPCARYLGEDPHKHILENHHKAMVKVQQHSQRTFKRSKRYYDRKTKNIKFNVGDPVYVYNTMKSSKLDQKWRPYNRIIEEVTPVNFIIRNVVTGNTRKVHALHLRKANLEWEIPQPAQGQRPLCRAQLAAPPTVVGDDSNLSSMDDGQFTDSDDIPLARVRERLRAVQTPQPPPTPQPPQVQDRVEVSAESEIEDNQRDKQQENVILDSSNPSDIDMVNSETNKRFRNSSSSEETSPPKKIRVNNIQKKGLNTKTKESNPKDKVKQLVENIVSFL